MLPLAGSLKRCCDSFLYFSSDKEVPDDSKQKEESPRVIKETIIGDKDLINALGEKKHEKSEIIKRRPRAILAATPMLEEIPEEKSHGSGSDTNNARIATDDSKNKGKKGKKHSSILQVCFLDYVHTMPAHFEKR